jgi:hypothetical protein
MSAVLRVWWTFFTAVPLQRWLGAFGCVLLLLGLGGGLLAADRSDVAVPIVMGFIGFAVFALFPAVFVTGALWRALAAPLQHQLYPYLRVRLLLAVILVVATLTASPLAFVAANEGPRAVALSSAAVAVTGLSTAVIFAVFIVTRYPRLLWLGLGLAGFITISPWLKGGGADSLRAAGFSATAVVGVLTLAAWAAFLVAYFRVARIKPMRLLAAGGGALDDTTAAPPLSRASASRSLLGGRLERPLSTRALLGAIGLGAILALVTTLLWRLPGTRTPPVVNFLWPWFAMFVTGPPAERAIRASRLLWLHTGGARRETLRIVEGFLGRFYLFTATAVATIAVLVPFLWSATVGEAVLLAATSLSAALCAIYVVLFARGSAPISVAGFVALLLVQLILLAPFKIEMTLPGAAALTLLQLAAAGVLRAAAIRRWRSVDWLRLRPVRDQRIL